MEVLVLVNDGTAWPCEKAASHFR